jgi:glycine/D-amino acid oxidase-like deaminating enzyme
VALLYLGKGIADVAEGGQTSLVSVLQPSPHAGWIDPRKHVLAHIELARRRGVEVVQELAVSITRSVCQEG